MFCFTANSLAESTIVAGNKDKLIVLTYTKYLDGKPVLIFSERALEESSNLLDKVDNIVFCDSAWQDLAGKLVDGKAKEDFVKEYADQMYNDFEPNFEDVRKTNEDMRKEADRQIDYAEERASDAESEIIDLNNRIDELE